MKIIEIKILRGPNYWSNYRKKLIAMKLDIGELESKPTNEIDGFLDRLKTMFPSMVSHRCSKGFEGGFFERVNEVFQHLVFAIIQHFVVAQIAL